MLPTKRSMMLAICAAFIMVSVGPSSADAEKKTRYERLGG